MAIAAEALTDDAALGRGAVEGMGKKPAAYKGFDFNQYGAHVRSSIGAGRPVKTPEQWLAAQGGGSAPAARQAAAPAAPAPSPRAVGRAIGTTLRVPGAGTSGAVQRIIAAAAVGLVVLEVGALLTGQDFHLQFPGNPLAALKAPPGYIGPSQVVAK